MSNVHTPERLPLETQQEYRQRQQASKFLNKLQTKPTRRLSDQEKQDAWKLQQAYEKP